MKENISIKGNETIEELVKKITTVESPRDKILACFTIITYLEIKNSVSPGSYTFNIAFSKKYPPSSPEEIEKLNQSTARDNSKFGPMDFGSDINTFLFYLKEIDENCYLDLVNTYEIISKKEKEKREKREKIIWIVIIGIIIVYFLLS